jgi:predicted amidohydrolase
MCAWDSWIDQIEKKLTILTESTRARPVDPGLATRYIKNSLSYDSQEIRRIQTAAEEGGIAVVLGFSENDGGSLYISQCVMDASGKIVMKRRKLKPTHMERTYCLLSFNLHQHYFQVVYLPRFCIT